MKTKINKQLIDELKELLREGMEPRDLMHKGLGGRILKKVEEIYESGRELESLMEAVQSPSLIIKYPFPPVPNHGRWIIKAAREKGMRNWQDWQTDDNDLFEALRKMKALMNE